MSGYYRGIAAAAARAARRAADQALAERSEEIHEESNGPTGVPGAARELRERHGVVNHKRVARLIRERGLAGICGARCGPQSRTGACCWRGIG
ncbi:IS3 family transposase [Kitasatospora gansuensis]|uniref:IS3 family transposase n=1 Tax=Kitasatospora gansuensis TaxID=258050 RepID=UPI0035E400E4